MSLVLNETLVLAKTRSQDLKSVLNFNCWGSGIKDVSLVRRMVNVEVFGLSCNEITTLEDFAYCPKLKELILRKNNIKNISEIQHLQNLPKLTNLWLGENPCAENTHNYRKVVLKALPKLTMLDNIPVTREELREIEELGNDIYEEVQYESVSNSSGSGPSSASNNFQEQQQQQHQNNNQHMTSNSRQATNQHSDYLDDDQDNIADQYNNINLNESVNEMNEAPTHVVVNQSLSTDSHHPNSFRQAHNNSRTSNFQTNNNNNNNHPHSRCLSLQGSVTTLNGGPQNQSWSTNYNNNNNNNSMSNNNVIPPRGGKSHTGNILSAVLCLVKELDYTSCEVVQTALNCRMEETSQ